MPSHPHRTKWNGIPHACQWPIILPLRFFYVWIFGEPSFDVLFFHFFGLIIRLNNDAFGKFKFVITPQSSSAIHFVCAYLETKIRHGNLNLV
jgi:hypothetical protein